MAAVAALHVGRGGGMNASHDRRLARLEQKRQPAANVFYVWRNAPMESAEEAIARTFPHGVPADAPRDLLMAGRRGEIELGLRRKCLCNPAFLRDPVLSQTGQRPSRRLWL
jgi:hypothetical protein